MGITFLRRMMRKVSVAGLIAGMAGAALPAAMCAQAPTAAPASQTATAPAQTSPGASNHQDSARSNAPQQAYTLPPDKLAQAIALNRIRNILGISGAIWGIVFVWLLLTTRRWAMIEGWALRSAKRRWVQGLLFFAAYFLISALAGLPFDWIGHHYERAYGISVQGWGSWFGDQAKALGITLLAGVPLLLLFNWIVRKWPRRYWFGAWLVTLPILIFAIFISPLVIPLFYKQEPLARNHAVLVAKLETVVARTGIDIPPDRMYLMKASEKSKGINAFVAGIGATKRYVMWDTATDQLTDDEVLWVFGHESGHYVLHHIPKEIADNAVLLLFLFGACAGFAAWMLKRFGSKWGAAGLSSRTGFVVLLMAISIASFLLQPASNALSRHFEHEADVYGQEAIHGIVADPQKTAVAAFNKLGASWLEDPNPNPLLEFWLYDHPSVQHRAEFAEHYDPWVNGGHGKFFKN